MIVDCHSRVWENVEQLGAAWQPDGPREAARGPRSARAAGGLLDASALEHLAASEPVDVTFAMGFKSRHLNAHVPATAIAAYVAKHPHRLVGVAGIDPTHLPEALADLKAANELGIKAINVAPSAQDFHPADSRAMQVFAEAAQLGMPVFVDQGVGLCAASKLEFARPALLDEVARELPQLKIVIGHLGHPWVQECAVLLGKHENVYADISALVARPWDAYNALLHAYQYGVIDKILFGSDFPFMTATSAIEAIYRINQLVTGTNLPTIPRQQLSAIVERDALRLLGIEAPAPTARPSGRLLDVHEG